MSFIEMNHIKKEICRYSRIERCDDACRGRGSRFYYWSFRER